jgi:glycosyltransferase involved in cell wall biosynthesis
MSVSVIIPNRNNAPFLERCLASTADDPAVGEILVYDDGSTDDSLAVIERYGSPKVRVIRGPGGLGATRARHEAILTANGRFLSFVDGDDYLADGTLSSCLRSAQEHDLDMCIPDQVKVDRNGKPTPFIPAPNAVTSGEDGLILTIGGWKLGAPRGVIRRDTYLAAVRGFEFYGYSDDELLARRTVLASRRIGGCAGTYFYRYEPRDLPPGQQAMRLRTLFKSLALATSLDRAAWPPLLRASRNEGIKQLIGLAPRLGKTDLEAVLADLAAVKLPWRPRDWPHLAAASVIRAAGAIRRG